jgi:chorismate dehydratase
MRIGRIPYINCYPVYGALDRGVVSLDAELVDEVPTDLNRRMAAGELDISVVSAVEYARDSGRYLLLPDLAISCDGPVRSVMLFSRRPVSELGGRSVIVSRSSMTSVALLELLFDHVWRVKPQFVPGDAELSDVRQHDIGDADARLVIGDAALLLGSSSDRRYPYSYDLGHVWKDWTGQPFVFAVWVAQRTAGVKEALTAHAALIESRNWGLAHLSELARQANAATGVDEGVCAEYLSGLDYSLSYPHLAGLTEFYRRLVERGRIPNGTLTFLPAA